MSGLTEQDCREAAAALAEAERDAKPIAPLSERWPGLEPADAYAIQQHNIEQRVARGATLRGHKVGLSSRAMQEMMGIDEPDYGHLLDEMFVSEGEHIETRALCAPRVEIEVAFVLGQALPGHSCEIADVLRATESVLPAIEVIDSRIQNWEIGLTDTIADNASSCRAVLGGHPVRLQELDDLRNIEATLSISGEEVARGSSSAVLGNPATAVAWLARKLAGFGVGLEEGHVILPGSCTRAFAVGPGQSVQAHFDGLGSVEVHFD